MGLFVVVAARLRVVHVDPDPAAGIDDLHPVDVAAIEGALVLAGLADWQRIAGQMGVTLAMLVDERGTVHMPPAMAARVHFAEEPPPVQLTAAR